MDFVECGEWLKVNEPERMVAVAEPERRKNTESNTKVHTSRKKVMQSNKPTNEMMNKQQTRRKKHKKAIDGEENENLIDFLVSRALTWLLLNSGWWWRREKKAEKHLERGDDDDVSEKKELENGHKKLTLIRNGEKVACELVLHCELFLMEY